MCFLNTSIARIRGWRYNPLFLCVCVCVRVCLLPKQVTQVEFYLETLSFNYSRKHLSSFIDGDKNFSLYTFDGVYLL